MNEHGDKFDWIKECGRLEEINKDLLKACRAMVKANTPETIDEAFGLIRQAISKAGKGE